MHKTNEAAQVMLSLDLATSSANSLLDQSWEQNDSNQGEDGGYLCFENN